MSKFKTLIVDDDEIGRLILEEILSEDYEVVQAESGEEAMKILQNSETLPSIVLLDISMPGMDGYEVLKRMKEDERLFKIPVIFITASDNETDEMQGLMVGANDYIKKPFNYTVLARVNLQIELKEYRDSLEKMVAAKVEEIMKTREHMLETLATIIECRNVESGYHVQRTCEMARVFINHMLEVPKFQKYLMENEYKTISKAASLHDVGKIGIPDDILLKPGKLTDEEFEIIKTHTNKGSDIIDSLRLDVDFYLKHCRDICRSHHERWDGGRGGYPDGLAGEAIPLSARVISIVDVYDALVSERVYKPAFSHEQAVEIIKKDSGTKFDPDLIEVFMKIHEELREISRIHADNAV